MTVLVRERTTRGIKKADSPITAEMRTHHNFVREHQGVGIGGATPAEKAGILVRGANKLKTLVQNAAVDNF